MKHGYNYRNQLSGSTRGSWNNPYYDEPYTYNYDDWGNLLTASAGVFPNIVTTTFNHATGRGGVPTTNRLSSQVRQGVTTNFTYDNAGNMTTAGGTTYAWDAANRLKNVNGGALGSYGYDGHGQRVQKAESGTTTYYVISSVLSCRAINTI